MVSPLPTVSSAITVAQQSMHAAMAFPLTLEGVSVETEAEECGAFAIQQYHFA